MLNNFYFCTQDNLRLLLFLDFNTNKHHRVLLFGAVNDTDSAGRGNKRRAAELASASSCETTT